MGLSHSPSIVTDGLDFYVDPNNTRCYPGFGNTVYNIVNSSIGATLVGFTSALLDNTEARSFYFDGTNDSLPFSNSSSYSPTKITVCIWFKKAHGSSFKALIDKGRDNYGAWTLCVDETANKVSFKAKIFYTSGVNQVITTSSNYNSNAWNFVCGVYDGAYLSIYLNGVLSNSAYYLQDVGSNSYPITVGAANDGYNVNANIGQAFIYGRALSAAEIQQLYHATKKKYLIEENIVTDGLTFNLDSANSSLYSGVGNTIFNLSGTGATLVNGVQFSNLNSGSFVFDGTNDYIDVSNPNLLAFGTNPFTIDLWLYSTYVYPGSGYNYGTILTSYTNYNSDFGTYFYLALFKNAAGFNNIVSFLDSTGNFMGVFGANINVNEWTNITFTRSGNNLVCYKNGVSVATQSIANNFSGTRNARIGGGVVSINTFQGSIPLMKIYNRTLTPTEIQQNYNATKNRFVNVLPVVRNGLVLELDAANTASYSGSGNTWYDLSGNGYNSTLVGSPVFSGIASTANFLFDANTKSATLDTSLLNNYSSGTIECSVYITNLASSFILARQRNGFNSYSVLSVGSYADGGGGFAAGTSGIVYYHNKNGQTVLGSSTALLVNTWYRLSITFTTSSVILYINGIQNATVAGDYSVPNDASTDPRIGAWIKDGTNYPMNGRLAHFTIYNRALSAYEIKQNFDFYRTRYGI